MLRVCRSYFGRGSQLERVTCHCDNRDVDPLASQGLQVLLALEIARRSSAPAHGNSPAHRKYGEGERHLGRRADCLRTLVKVGHLCFSAPWASIGPSNRAVLDVDERLRNTGGPSSRIMPEGSWPAISWFQSRSDSSCCLSS